MGARVVLSSKAHAVPVTVMNNGEYLVYLMYMLAQELGNLAQLRRKIEPLSTKQVVNNLKIMSLKKLGQLMLILTSVMLHP